MKNLLIGLLFIICTIQFVSCSNASGQGTTQSSFKYIAISGDNTDWRNPQNNFNTAVMNKLNDGWKTVGGMSVSGNTMYQAMYK